MGRLCRYFLSLFLLWKEFFIPRKTLLRPTSMAMSKHQLTGSLTKKTLTLEGKIKLLDANKERKQSCRQLAEMFNIGKTAAANIIKNEASIRKEYEESKDDLKRKRKGQFNDINEIFTRQYEDGEINESLEVVTEKLQVIMIRNRQQKKITDLM